MGFISCGTVTGMCEEGEQGQRLVLVPVLWFEEKHPRNKRGRETIPSIRPYKQARLPVLWRERQDKRSGEEESREKSKGVGIGEFPKEVRCHYRGGDTQQAPEMAEIGLEDSKEKSGKRKLYLKH